ncbi:hypothetical protein [Acetobacterium sp.]|uniref:hypothetical protein n=1 Tax=Acetobacterium sp. TaxID=1872094 RepID=UPI0027278BFD|nr:hypothetical protein [Acetobacterium sp.]MDO9492740.1 hypothetical protein [Acetobacterium sp.]
MEFQNVIEARRSMRKYDASKKVDETTVKAMIAVGYTAQEARMPPRKAADEVLKFF